MVIPLSIFYFIYAGLVFIFLIFSFFHVYHLVRFGFLSVSNIAVITLYILVSMAILSISWYYISQFDWSAQIPFSIQVQSQQITY